MLGCPGTATLTWQPTTMIRRLMRVSLAGIVDVADHEIDLQLAKPVSQLASAIPNEPLADDIRHLRRSLNLIILQFRVGGRRTDR